MSHRRTMKRDYLQCEDVADVLNMPVSWVREEIDDGRIPADIAARACRPGRKFARRIIRVYPEPFAVYLAKHWPVVYKQMWASVEGNPEGWRRPRKVA